MNFIQRCWASLRDAANSNRVIAVATIVIAIAALFTLVETINSGRQTDRIIAADKRLASATESSANAMQRSAGEAIKNTQLQIELAQIAHSIAKVELTPWLGVYHEKDEAGNDKYFAFILVHNASGNSPATGIEIAARVEYQSAGPTDLDYATLTDFRPTNPDYLPAYQKELRRITVAKPEGGQKATYENSAEIDNVRQEKQADLSAKNIYVWGKIRYKVFTQPVEPVRFCRFVAVKKVIGTRPGLNGGSSAFNDCLIEK